MAVTNQDIKFISRLNAGFPEYLDWEKLRETGLKHLGDLSGKIWTDHNLHDPGITILEMLCYAIMDLGYRTNLPEADLFAGKPGEQAGGNDLLTPASILTCNPVTITDFRKLLVDIEGVRNAWLEDMVYSSACYDPDKKQFSETPCSACYNGLYRVLIEAEDGFDPDATAQNEPYVSLINKIRDTLMAHRNFCEDFVDIRVLCKKKIGLCADIDLENAANPDEVYQAVVENLRAYFSPAPTFYTLSQMLDEKKRTMEEIFAGRPYDVEQSHGFVDTGEFEAIKPRKELHLSDLYTVILNTPGVGNVYNLGWKMDTGPGARADNSWVLNLPKDHVADFSPTRSAFRFTRNGIPVFADTEKYNDLLEAGFAHNGKVLYKMPSPYLDAELPPLVYREGVFEYQSIQNDFPRVYGISRGGLSPDVSDKRKAQAYQLKAYLLFFDQLLANYLAQLGNMRSLFSFSGDSKGKPFQSHFLNQLTDIPELEKLFRFPVQNAEDEYILGSGGNLLAVPVSRTWLEEGLADGSINRIDPDHDVYPEFFKDRNACETAINMLQMDMSYGDYEAVTFSVNSNNCWYFCFITSLDKIALISQKLYGSRKEAEDAAAAVKYAAAWRENYHITLGRNNKFSFTLELNKTGYEQYLQPLGEDKSLYLQRRRYFLDHLLARFAERFTEFALLSYGFFTEEKLAELDNRKKENFLSRYGELSANRGKAYDYRADGWNNENLSGFEKRSFARAGVDKIQRHHLCHFVVEPYEAFFLLGLYSNDNKALFHISQRYYSREAADTSAKQLMEALTDKSAYSIIYDETRQGWVIRLCFGHEGQALYVNVFEKEEDAGLVRHDLVQLFSIRPANEDIQVSRYIHRLILRDHGGNEIAEGLTVFDDAEAAEQFIHGQTDLVKGTESWNFTSLKPAWFEEACTHRWSPGKPVITNRLAFKFDVDNTIIGKPDLFKFELLDQRNNFKFYSVKEYALQIDAEQACLGLLFYLGDEDNYKTFFNEGQGRYELHIIHDQQLLARSDPFFETEPEAVVAKEKIYKIVRQEQYTLHVEPRYGAWDFRYVLPDAFGRRMHFHSVKEYPTHAEALEHAVSFHAAVNEMRITPRDNSFLLSAKTSHGSYQLEPDEAGDMESAKAMLALKQSAYQLSGPEGYQALIQDGVKDPDKRFLYRLVDKDHLHAEYKKAAASVSFAEAENLKKSIFQNTGPVAFTGLFFGGECIVKRKYGPAGAAHYHYQVKASPEYVSPGKAVTLFESRRGYLKQEEAIAALNDDLMEILSLGMDPGNYGTGRPISTDPETPHSPRYGSDPSLVTVADGIRDYFRWHPLEDLIAALTKICKQCPYRRTAVEEDEFYQLFPCEKDNRDPRITSCCGGTGKKTHRYYFVLADKDGNVVWQSMAHWDTLQETIQRFGFFRMLLEYPGNYCVQQDYCNAGRENNAVMEKGVCGWKVYLREVLAESHGRYGSKDEAWKGVEEFICVSQKEGSFHTYFSCDAGAYTFDVGCGNTGLLHSCTYDTAELRNEALKKLHEPFRKGWQWPALCFKGPDAMLMDTTGELVAWVDPGQMPAAGGPDCIQCMVELMMAVQNSEYKVDENAYWLEYKGQRVAWPLQAGSDGRKWEQALRALACHYPVKLNASGKYTVIIRLPGFSCCGVDPADECSAGQPDIESHDCSCCTAWESPCCFDSCEKAFAWLDKITSRLADPVNYQPVFECECGPYGIRLVCSCHDEKNRGGESGHCCNPIVAYNPQKYATPRMDCDAVLRAKKLINTEGFHAVEHILLRPRCEDDCNKNGEVLCMVPVCQQPRIECPEWTWKPSAEPDPCDPTQAELPFRPGKDPYSFIATVVLPAWPERFRKKDNRLIMENLLYNEAPAHILLRICWLAPEDFCRFEYYYKRWSHWNSRDGADKCIANDPTCELVNLLFTKPFDELEDCNVCVACEEIGEQEEPCFEQAKDPCGSRSFQGNLNELYCWNRPVTVLKRKKDLSRLSANQATQKEPRKEPDLEILSQALEQIEWQNEIRDDLSEDTKNFFSRRKNSFLNKVKMICNETNWNKLAEESLQFIREEGDFNLYLSLTTAIMNNEKEDKRRGRKFIPEQQQALVSNLTKAWLDRVILSGTRKTGDFEPLEKQFRKLRKKGLDTMAILNEWHKTGLEDHCRGLKPEEIRSILGAKNR